MSYTVIKDEPAEGFAGSRVQYVMAPWGPTGKDPAIRFRVINGYGVFDPYSTSTVPMGVLAQMVEQAVLAAGHDGAVAASTRALIAALIGNIDNLRGDAE